MDDARIWAFEESLWKADEAHYRESVDPAYVLVVPLPPYVMQGQEAVDSLVATPDWTEVRFEQTRVARPQHGMIVIGYHVHAEREGDASYQAHCSSTYRLDENDKWWVVQHQQTPLLAVSG